MGSHRVGVCMNPRELDLGRCVPANFSRLCWAEICGAALSQTRVRWILMVKWFDTAGVWQRIPGLFWGVPGHGKLTKPSQNRGSELSNATTVQQGNGVVDITRSKDGLDLMPANAAATATPARGHPGVLPGHNKR